MGAEDLAPVQALTTSEGGLFVSGAAMTKDMRLRTVATLCRYGTANGDKIRAGDGMLIAGEKRLVVHFMIQPNFVSELLGDPVLRQQGFLSRLLIAWPGPGSGSGPMRATTIGKRDAGRGGVQASHPCAGVPLRVGRARARQTLQAGPSAKIVARLQQ